jgi:hypothetical protein
MLIVRRVGPELIVRWVSGKEGSPFWTWVVMAAMFAVSAWICGIPGIPN